ncbi:hypothetical protein [Mycobacterium sp. 1245111.1]|uniref:hypothetical protein n=1 Tax=Mycobacterium sp. 1245111.1 TaxID=1834073 RepID=UPI000AF17281|nr:hypothetical protein [Mycobacterium sp. 1245111.1]
MTNTVRRLATGVGLAGGAAVAAAMIGTVGAPAAWADDGSIPTDIGLLNTAQTDIVEAFSLSGHADAGTGFFPELEAIQTPLLSSDNSLVSGFGEVLFNGPDQNLFQASEAFLSAAEALSSDTTNLIALGDYASTGFQVIDSIFGEIPSTIIGKLTDQIFDIGGFDTGGAGTAADIATSAAAAGNQYDPAVFDYSADPNNIFSPVYTISPTGPEDVTVTDASGDVFGTQEFTISELGFPVGTFTGNVEYGAVSSPLDIFGSPYGEDISVLGVPGTLLPENTSFVVEEFGGGWGNVLELAMNSTGTSDTVGDYLMTPFGTENLTPIVDFLLNYTGTLPEAATAVDPSSFVDLLSSIGL